MDWKEKLGQLILNLEDPSPEAYTEFERLKEGAIKDQDRLDFYIAVDVRSEVHFPWSHNTARILGLEKGFTVQDFIDRIHPEWRAIYLIYSTAAYGLAYTVPEAINNQSNLVYNISLPIRCPSGEYWWFRQVSKVAVTDTNGMMVIHFNRYHRLSPYRKMLPSDPFITFKGKFQSRLVQVLKRFAAREFQRFSTEYFSPTSWKIIEAYSKMAALTEQGWEVPKKQVMAKKMGLTETALDRAIVRLLKQGRMIFPSHAVTGIQSLINHFNDFFPREKSDEN